MSSSREDSRRLIAAIRPTTATSATTGTVTATSSATASAVMRPTSWRGLIGGMREESGRDAATDDREQDRRRDQKEEERSEIHGHIVTSGWQRW